jgi:hypothetical protein
MSLYEITGYIKIPVSATVEAETPAKAFEIGKDLINDGIGIEGDQYLTEEYYVWDIAKRESVEVVFTHVGHGHK